MEHPAPHRRQDRRLLRPLCARDGPGEAQGHRQGVPGVQRRHALLEHHLRVAVLRGRPAVDEGLRLQRRVEDPLQEGLARQVIGAVRPLFALLVGSGILLGLVGLSPTEAQTPKRGGTLRVSYGNEIAHLDFHTAPGYEMMWVAMNVGCGLVNITPDGKFVGDAAESWQVAPDGLLYTFKLKKNVLFHDGTKVDAAAVKFSIDRLMDPATGSGMRTFYESVHSVEAGRPPTPPIPLH